MEKGKEVQEEIMSEQEFLSLGKKRSDSGGERGGRMERGKTRQAKATAWHRQEAGRDVHTGMCKSLGKVASQRNTLGIEIWTLALISSSRNY